ncbi:tripartite tricarboxylate transporter substrate-binding protein, partial [Acinetobacter baumannii]|nr:tripartite tricarboxylate transporter substrate-binding protein [Acinetobacter baumannii]
LPDVPTSAEAGFPQFQSVTWYGLFAPKGTPQAVGEALVAATREAVKAPDARRAIETAGGEPLVNSMTEFSAQVRRDSERLSALVKKYPIE